MAQEKMPVEASHEMPHHEIRLTLRKATFNEHVPESAESRQSCALLIFHFLRALHRKSRGAAQITGRHLGWCTSDALMSVNNSRRKFISKIKQPRKNLANCRNCLPYDSIQNAAQSHEDVPTVYAQDGTRRNPKKTKENSDLLALG